MRVADAALTMQSISERLASENQVVFRHLLDFLGNPTPWIAVSALATLALAWKTWQLAKATTEMASETKDLVNASGSERLQAERHHQEQLMPLVILKASGKIITTAVGRFFRLEGRVGNVGGGPATRILVRVRPDGNQTFYEPLSVLGAAFEVDFGFGFDIQDPVHGDGLVGFKTIVTFESIFGTVGAVYQTSHSGEIKDMKVDTVVLCSGDHTDVENLIRYRLQDEPKPLI